MTDAILCISNEPREMRLVGKGKMGRGCTYSFESHEAPDIGFDHDELERQALLEHLAQKKAKPDRNPMILLTLEDDDEISKVAISKTEGFLRFPTYCQISKDSDLGKFVLKNIDSITPGFILQRCQATIVDINLNFISTEEPIF